jgi:hypothetical protein
MNLELGSPWARAKRIAIEAHKHIALWYSYLVATSVTLQASWDQLDQFCPPKARHWIIGIATVVAVADRVRQAAQRIG